MQAIWKGHVVAEAPKEQLLYLEGNWYFPLPCVQLDMLRTSPTSERCPWKGEAQYFDVGSGRHWSKDTAFAFPDPEPAAIDTVKRDFSQFVAFWRDVAVVEN